MKKTLKQQLADAKAKIKRQDELLEAAAKVIQEVAESSAPKWFVVTKWDGHVYAVVESDEHHAAAAEDRRRNGLRELPLAMLEHECDLGVYADNVFFARRVG